MWPHHQWSGPPGPTSGPAYQSPCESVHWFRLELLHSPSYDVLAGASCCTGRQGAAEVPVAAATGSRRALTIRRPYLPGDGVHGGCRTHRLPTEDVWSQNRSMRSGSEPGPVSRRSGRRIAPTLLVVRNRPNGFGRRVARTLDDSLSGWVAVMLAESPPQVTSDRFSVPGR